MVDPSYLRQCEHQIQKGLLDAECGATFSGSLNRNTAKTEAKLRAALAYLTRLNETEENRSAKWVINESLLFSLTGCFRKAISKFMLAHQSKIDGLNAKHGLGPGHNRAKARFTPVRSRK